MTQGSDVPGERARNAELSAAIEDIKPYAMAAGAVSLLGTPAEFGVPLVRRLRGKSGVSIGPGLMNLVNGAVAMGLVRFFRERPAQWERWKRTRMAGWARLVGLAYVALSPVAAASLKPAVILPRRSPLWAGLISPIGVLPIALLIRAFYRARRTRLSAPAGASENDVEPSHADGPGPLWREETARDGTRGDGFGTVL
jgi:hypothetical protein